MKAVFLDRDGTMIIEPPDKQIDSLEKFELVPGVIQGLRLLLENDYALVMVSNQDGLGTDSYPVEKYELVQSKLLKLLAGEGISFAKILVCPHNPDAGCSCRKPKIGLVEEYIQANSVDIGSSYVLGDRETDVEFARNIGCKSVRLASDDSTIADYSTESFVEACRFIADRGRTASVQRTTTETDISVDVCLDGTGAYEINSGIGFFDHMLAQLSKHSGIDMKIRVKGDLKVDEHHSVEDTGLVLGEAIRKALGRKRGIERYGFLLPMDESLAQVALDLGGRTYCSFNVKFRREKIGELPTEIVEDFFRALAEGLKANIHITVTGRNDHHKAEAIFKAMAKSLAQAVSRNRNKAGVMPSTKGVV